MNSRFEIHAQNQLNGHEIPVDADALWAGIEPHVKPEKGNKKVFWFFMLGLIVGFSGFGFFYASQSDTELSLDSNNLATTEYVSENPMTIGTSEKNNTSKSIETKTTTIEAIATDSNKETKSIIVAATSTTKEAKSIVQKENVAKYNSATKKQIAKVSKKSIVPANATQSNTQSPILKVETLALAVTPKTKNINIENLGFRNAVSKLPFLFPAKQSLKRGFEDKPFIAMMKEQQAENRTLLDKAKRDELAKAKSAQKKKRQRGSFFRDLQFGLGLYGGVSQSTTSLESGSDDLTYELLRSNSEKQLETVHLGLSALILTEQKAYFRTGIEYTRIGSLFSRDASSVTTDSVPGTVEILINNITGDTTFVPGQVLRTTTSNYIKKSYNYFHLIDVPVILGYNFGSDPWSIGVEAGIYANIMVKTKGEIADTDDTFYDKENDPGGWYKNNIGISPFVGFNVGYKMTDNIQIHFSPSFRFSSTFSTSNNPLVEKHGTLGVNAGVRYLFDN